MASTKKAAEEKVLAPEYVEVEHVLGASTLVFLADGHRVEFVDGKASVSPEVAELLKKAELIK